MVYIARVRNPIRARGRSPSALIGLRTSAIIPYSHRRGGLTGL